MSLYLIGQHLARNVVMIKTVSIKIQRNASVARLANPCGAPFEKRCPRELFTLKVAKIFLLLSVIYSCSLVKVCHSAVYINFIGLNCNQESRQSSFLLEVFSVVEISFSAKEATVFLLSCDTSQLLKFRRNIHVVELYRLLLLLLLSCNTSTQYLGRSLIVEK